MQRSLFRAMREAEEAGYLAGSKNSSYMNNYGYDYEDEYDSYGYDSEALTEYGTLRERREAAIADVNFRVKAALKTAIEKYGGDPAKAAKEIAMIRNKGIRDIEDIEAEYGQNAETVGLASKIAHWAIQAGKVVGISLIGATAGSTIGSSLGARAMKKMMKNNPTNVNSNVMGNAVRRGVAVGAVIPAAGYVGLSVKNRPKRRF